jgi:hypothetical protein
MSTALHVNQFDLRLNSAVPTFTYRPCCRGAKGFGLFLHGIRTAYLSPLIHRFAVQVQVPLPRLPEALAAVVADARFPSTAHAINHNCNYVTTFAAPRAGCGFHEPLHPPCLLNLHGTVHHWLRSAQAQPDTDAVADARLAMQQWWMTPDDTVSNRIEDLMRQFRAGLLQCNPITAQLVRACKMCSLQPSNHVALGFQHGDTVPDMLAVYHCGSADRVPPELLLCKWAACQDRPRCKLTLPGDSDLLAFVTLFPSADRTFHSHLTLTSGRRMTRSQWTRHLIAHVPHVVLQLRVFQEFLLQAWNEVENQRLRCFCQCVGSEDVDNLEGYDEARGGDSDSGSDNDCDGHASFIPAAFTGGAARCRSILRNGSLIKCATCCIGYLHICWRIPNQAITTFGAHG